MIFTGLIDNTYVSIQVKFGASRSIIMASMHFIRLLYEAPAGTSLICT